MKPIQSIIVLTSLLIVAPDVKAALISNFDDGTTQGWSSGDPFDNGSFGGILSVINSGGNPRGYLRATDTVEGAGTLATLAPTFLSGDLTGLGRLSWDVLLPKDSVLSTSILLEGADGTFYRSNNALLSTQPINSWFTKSVDFGLNVDWQLVRGINRTGSFSSVVSDTQALYIELDVTKRGTGFNPEAGIDNVRTTQETVPEPSIILGSIVALGLGSAMRRKLFAEKKL